MLIQENKEAPWNLHFSLVTLATKMGRNLSLKSCLEIEHGADPGESSQLIGPSWSRVKFVGMQRA